MESVTVFDERRHQRAGAGMEPIRDFDRLLYKHSLDRSMTHTI
jgi:hypothetical protein